MSDQLAPGLPADWLNGWLAALGVTVLLPEVELSWTADPVPLAVFRYPEGIPLAERIANALPDGAELQQRCLAALPRKVTLPAYKAAAARSRGARDGSLAMSLTDLVSGRTFDQENLPHGAFDPPAPRGITLVERAVTCRQLLEHDSAKKLADTLDGVAVRAKANGLGFDIRRVPSGVQPSADVMVDPAVECLCFSALVLFPIRGDGRRACQRGWDRTSTQRGVFTWPAWSKPLGVWGIDALLDHFYAGATGRTQELLGIVGSYASVPYQSTGSSDVTRGYGSLRIT